jgi:hypothetical protein
MTAQTATKTAPAPKSLKPCSCRRFEVGTFDADQPDAPSWTTDCDRSTHRLFAQGHDAKLVGFLVRGQLDGYEVRSTEGGVSVTYPDAVAAAGTISGALAAKARNMLRVAKEKADAKAQREAEKATKKAEKQAASKEPGKIKAKVGRWEVEGTVTEGRLTYTTKSGEEKTAEVGKWSSIA